MRRVTVLHAHVAVHSSSRREFVNQNRGVKDTIFQYGDIKISANLQAWRKKFSLERFC
jgi:hypothetical protein